MGMSPSCHCICPGTGGTSSSSDSRIFTCGACSGGAARQYKITVTQPPTDSTACCCSMYTGEFVLTHLADCSWQSEELALCAIRPNPGVPYCALHSTLNDRRFTMGIGRVDASTVRYTIIFTQYVYNGISGRPDIISHTLQTDIVGDCFAGGTILWSSWAVVGSAVGTASCYVGAQFGGRACAIDTSYTSANCYAVVTAL